MQAVAAICGLYMSLPQACASHYQHDRGYEGIAVQIAPTIAQADNLHGIVQDAVNPGGAICGSLEVLLCVGCLGGLPHLPGLQLQWV